MMQEGILLCWVLLMSIRANATLIGSKFIFVQQGGLPLLISCVNMIADTGLTYLGKKTVLEPMASCTAYDLRVLYDLYSYL